MRSIFCLTRSRCKCKCNLFYKYPRSTKELWELVSNVTVRSRSNWNFEMLVFEEGGKPQKAAEKNSRSEQPDENQHTTNSTHM